MNIETPVRPANGPDRLIAAEMPSVILVGAVDDHDGGSSPFGQFSWFTRRVRELRDFREETQKSCPRVVVCEQQLPDGTWKDVLEISGAMHHPAPVVVTSRLADERLWAEVLNLGGYDLLAKPLDRREVFRTMNLAWQHWKNEQRSRERAAATAPHPKPITHHRRGASIPLKVGPHASKQFDPALDCDIGA